MKKLHIWAILFLILLSPIFAANTLITINPNIDNFIIKTDDLFASGVKGYAGIYLSQNSTGKYFFIEDIESKYKNTLYFILDKYENNENFDIIHNGQVDYSHGTNEYYRILAVE